MADPLVSISCITYNHEKYIGKCLEGFLMQKTTFPFEILIHDDASTDKTAEVIKKYAKQFNFIKPLLQKENQYSKGVRGINIKFNFPRASGQYIALCEGDDYWTDPYKLQKQVDFLNGNQNYVACFTDAIILDERDGCRIPFVKNKFKERINFNNILDKGGGFYPTASIMFRHNNSLYFPEFIHQTEAGDWALSLILATIGDFYYLDDTTCLYRKHSGGAFTSIENNLEQRRKMNINSIKFLLHLNQFLDYKKNREIKKRISQLSKKIILRTKPNKFTKENMNYFQQLNFVDFLSLLKNSFP